MTFTWTGRSPEPPRNPARDATNREFARVTETETEQSVGRLLAVLLLFGAGIGIAVLAGWI